MSENIARITAQKLLNLYRQEHVIDGGWTVLNPYFLSEVNDEVVFELKKLPNGWKLVKHIDDLKSNTVAMDSIDPNLLPYGGLIESEPVYKVVQSVVLPSNEMESFVEFLQNFEPKLDFISEFKKSSFFKLLGNDWENQAKLVLSNSKRKDTDVLMRKLKQLIELNLAYDIWYKAVELINSPHIDKTKAEIQASLTNFETYLPRFGKQGNELLQKIRGLIVSNGAQENE